MIKRKTIAALTLVSIVSLSFIPVLVSQVPIANLVAAFPVIPSWIITAASVVAEAASAVTLVIALLSSAGIAVAAFPIRQYIMKYGVKRGLIL